MGSATTDPVQAEQPEDEMVSEDSSEDDTDEEGWEDMDASPADPTARAVPDSPDAAMAEGDHAAVQEATAFDEEDVQAAAEAHQVSLSLTLTQHSCLPWFA